MLDRDGGDRGNGGGSEIALTAAAVAEEVGGRLIGDAAAIVRGVAPLDQAGPDHLSFLAISRYVSAFENSNAGVVLIAPDLVEAEGRARARIVVDRPHEALLRVLGRFRVDGRSRPGIDPSARIGRGVRLGREVSIGAHVVVGDSVAIGDRVRVGANCSIGESAVIGADSELLPNATLYPGTILGERVIVHSGARIGSDGFGYVSRRDAHEKIPHVGRCVLEDDVEIGANTTIDRGSVGDTVIGAGTKIDNLVQIGHNVRIGRMCMIAAQVGIAGSTRIDDGVVIGGQAGIGGHLVIGAGVRIAGQAGVFGDIPAGESWSGYPARPHREALRAQAALFRIAPLMRKLERLLGGSGTPPSDQ